MNLYRLYYKASRPFMKLGPDVIQPQPQLISGPCNTPWETKKKKKKKLIGCGGQRQWVESEGERCYPRSSRPWRVCRGWDKRGAAAVEPGSQSGGWGYSLLCCESLRRLPRAWLAVIQGGQAEGAPLSPLCSPSICLNLTMAHQDQVGWRGGAAEGSQNGRKWARGAGLKSGGATCKTLGGNARQHGEKGRDGAGEGANPGALRLLRLNEWCCSWQALTDYIGKGRGGGCSHCYIQRGNGLAAPLHSE